MKKNKIRLEDRLDVSFMIYLVGLSLLIFFDVSILTALIIPLLFSGSFLYLTSGYDTAKALKKVSKFLTAFLKEYGKIADDIDSNFAHLIYRKPKKTLVILVNKN